MRPHAAPPRKPGDEHDRQDHDPRRPGRQDRDQDHGARRPGPEEQLAFGTDVPEPHPEGEGAGEAGQDERGGLDQRVGDGAGAAEGRADDVDVDPDRVRADDRQDEPRDDERDDEGAGRQRGRQPARRLQPRLQRERERHAAAEGAHAAPPRRDGTGSVGPALLAGAAGHLEADRGHVGIRGGRDPDHPALVQDGDAIRERQDLVQVLGDEEDRGAGGPALHEQPVGRFHRAHVEPARGLDRDHQARLGVDLAGKDQALDVAAREQAGLGLDRRGGDLVAVLELARGGAGGAHVDRPAAADRLRPVALHDQVVDQREVGRGPDAGPVLGHVGHAPLDRLAYRPVGDVLAADHDPAAARAEATDDLGQLALAVARDGRDADDLAGADLEVHAAQRRDALVALGFDVLERRARHRRGAATTARGSRGPRGRP